MFLTRISDKKAASAVQSLYGGHYNLSLSTSNLSISKFVVMSFLPLIAALPAESVLEFRSQIGRAHV